MSNILSPFSGSHLCLLPQSKVGIRDDWLPGVKFANGAFLLSSEFFGCCDGAGARKVGPGTFERCDLRARFGALVALGESFSKQWSGVDLIAPKHPDHWCRILEKILSSPRAKGEQITWEGEGPSELWGIAAMAIWHFGISCQVINLKRANNFVGIDMVALKKWNTENRIILVEGIESIPNSEQIFNLELLVNFAYNSEVPIFLAKLGADSPGASLLGKSRSTSAMAQFRSRMEKLQKEGQGLFGLSGATQDRIRAVCRIP